MTPIVTGAIKTRTMSKSCECHLGLQRLGEIFGGKNQ